MFSYLGIRQQLLLTILRSVEGLPCYAVLRDLFRTRAAGNSPTCPFALNEVYLALSHESTQHL